MIIKTSTNIPGEYKLCPKCNKMRLASLVSDESCKICDDGGKPQYKKKGKEGLWEE